MPDVHRVEARQRRPQPDVGLREPVAEEEAAVRPALVQLFTLSAETIGGHWQRYARPLGAVMIGLGIYTLVVGVSRYFIVQDALIRGVYPVARVSTVLLSFALFSFTIAVFAIILTAR